jgi:hypothetical protein
MSTNLDLHKIVILSVVIIVLQLSPALASGIHHTAVWRWLVTSPDQLQAMSATSTPSWLEMTKESVWKLVTGMERSLCANVRITIGCMHLYSPDKQCAQTLRFLWESGSTLATIYFFKSVHTCAWHTVATIK